MILVTHCTQLPTYIIPTVILLTPSPLSKMQEGPLTTKLSHGTMIMIEPSNDYSIGKVGHESELGVLPIIVLSSTLPTLQSLD